MMAFEWMEGSEIVRGNRLPPQETGHHPEAKRTLTLPVGETGRVGRPT
jgi:hypothetical protein